MSDNQATGWGPHYMFVLPDGRVAWWVARHVAGIDKTDENGHTVKGKDARGWVKDFTGTITKASHGQPRKYYCVSCMDDLGSLKPPRSWW